MLGGFTIFQRTTCSGYLKSQNKRTGWFWVFEKDQNQRTTGSGQFTTLKEPWVLSGSLTIFPMPDWSWAQVFGIFGLHWLYGFVPVRLLVGVWFRDYQLWLLVSKSTRKCKTFNQIAMKNLLLVCHHCIHNFLQRCTTYLIKNLSK